jgi:ABC-type iron transport system FetAB ATPase subunit
VLWVSHDPAQARRVASRHFRLTGGRLEEISP